MAAEIKQIPGEVMGDIYHYLNPNRLHMLASYSTHARYVVNNYVSRARYIEKWLPIPRYYISKNSIYTYAVGYDNYVDVDKLIYVMNNYWYFRLLFEDDTKNLINILGNNMLRFRILYICISNAGIYAGINDINIQALTNIHSICLHMCDYITDISPLANTHTLMILRCTRILDMSALCNVHRLMLDICVVKDISMLGSVYHLRIAECDYISDISALSNIHTLDLGYNQHITDTSSISKLGNMHTFKVVFYKEITDNTVLNGLGNVNTLELHRCGTHINNVVFTRLGAVSKIRLFNFAGIEDVSMLPNVSYNTYYNY